MEIAYLGPKISLGFLLQTACHTAKPRGWQGQTRPDLFSIHRQAVQGINYYLQYKQLAIAACMMCDWACENQPCS